MKKKILSLALILMLVGAMFVLTGCGSDENSVEETNNSEVKNSEEQETEESTLVTKIR